MGYDLNGEQYQADVEINVKGNKYRRQRKKEGVRVPWSQLPSVIGLGQRTNKGSKLERMASQR